MNTQDCFINTRTGEVVEVIDTEGDRSKVATITATGARIRDRYMKTSSLKRTLSSKRGVEWKAAYVALDALPEGHPLRPAQEVPKQVEEAPKNVETDTRTPNLKQMSNEELSDYANSKRAEKMMAEFFMEEAKAELKSRYREPGRYLNGNVYVEVSSNQRFDAATAKSVLTDQEYASILKPKPDAARAREILTEDRYKAVCKDHGNKMEIRSATDKDRMQMREREEIQSAREEIESYSMYPSEPVLAPF